jgi:putative peptide zinc metalloprotease protein
MALPRPALPSAPALLRRPAALVPMTALALAALLGGGLLVANAVDGPVTSPVGTATPAEPSSDASPPPTEVPAPDSEQAPGEGPTTTSGGDDNVAVALNTRDGSTVYAVRLKVVMTGADVVDSGNAAVAAASCSDCTTVAIALEGVVVTGDAEVVAPQNIALAINSGCSGCQTLAYAYQDLQTVDGKVRLTGAGRRTIAGLRAELNGLRRSGLDVAAVKAEVDRIARAFAAVLDDELVPIGPATGAPAGQDAPTAGGAPEPASGAADGASPSPPAPETEPSPELSAEPSPGPEPTGTPLPSAAASGSPSAG